MNISEVLALREAIAKLGAQINDRFEAEQKETLEKVDVLFVEFAESINKRFAFEKKEILDLVSEQLYERNFQQSASVDGEPFYRLQSYISTLVQVQSTNHNVHKELEEAISKLKELAYKESP